MLDSRFVIILGLSLFLFLLPFLRKEQVRWTTSELIAQLNFKKESTKLESIVVDPDKYLYPEIYDELMTLINKEKNMKINIFITLAINKHTSFDYFLYELNNGIIENVDQNYITLFFCIEDRVKVIQTEGKTIKLYLADWEIDQALEKFISSFERKYFNYAITAMTKYLLDSVNEGRKSINDLYIAIFVVMTCLIFFPIVLFIGKNFKRIKEILTFRHLLVYFNNYTDKNDHTSGLKDKCVICLDNLMQKDGKSNSFSILDCRHCFHSNCLSDWKKNNSNCPICRRKFV